MFESLYSNMYVVKPIKKEKSIFLFGTLLVFEALSSHFRVVTLDILDCKHYISSTDTHALV